MKLNAKKQLRLEILTQYVGGLIYYRDAMDALGVSERHLRRLVKAFKEKGIESLVHGNSGNVPPNKTGQGVETKIVRLYKSVYMGMNVTHFMEKLVSVEGVEPPSYSTVRKILLKEKLISPYVKRKKKAHPRRIRYQKEGLMVQIDGSHHRWILGAEMMCLTAAIDDATGKILGMKMTKTETTFAAMDVVEQIIKENGIFQMLYSDRAGIYGGIGKREGYSNMRKAMDELGIISVHANTPQAKGRIERLFRTLQSRLPMEFRLNGVTTMEEANFFLRGYMKEYNRKFSIPAKESEPAYKPLDLNIDLNEVFVKEYYRKIKNGHIVSYTGKQYLLNSSQNLTGKEANLRFYRDGTLQIHVHGKNIPYVLFEENLKAS